MFPEQWFPVPTLVRCVIAFSALSTLATAQPVVASAAYEQGLVQILSSFVGGGAAEAVRAVAVDSAGNGVIVGNTFSVDFPWQVDLRSVPGGGDIFVVKVAADGSRVISATVIGGSDDDDVQAVALDASDDIYLVGTTVSADFPTRHALQNACGGCSSVPRETDAFVTKLDATGSSIVWSTFLGGSRRDAAHAMRVDGAGHVWIMGETESADFPAVGPIAPFEPFRTFVARVDTGGTALDFSTPLPLGFTGRALTIDASGHALVAADTFPGDVAVLAVSAVPTSVVTVGSIAGNGRDEALAIAALPGGDVAIAGRTASSDLATSGSLDPTPSTAGGGDAFVARMRVSDGAVVWTTYLGTALRWSDLRMAANGRGELAVIGNGYGTEIESVPAAGAVPRGNLLISRDGGRAFTRAASPPSAITGFAFDPEDADTIYGATPAGAHVTHDGGKSWQRLGVVGTPYDYVGQIVVDPRARRTVYATGLQGLVRSRDGGTTWTHVGALGTSFVSAFAIDALGSTLYAATSEGLRRSVDDGATWQPASLGLPYGYTVQRLVADPTRAGSIWVQLAVGYPASDAAPADVVYFSGNHGVSWVPRSHGLAPLYFDLALAPSDSSTLYAVANHAVFRTTNAGGHWEMVNIPAPDNPLMITVHPRDARTIFVSGFSTLYRSVDGGRTLLPVRGLPTPLFAGAIGVSPVDPDLVLAAVPPSGDTFVAVVSADGTRLVASSWIGGVGSDYIGDVAFWGDDDLWFTSNSASSDLPTRNGVQSRLAGASDVYVVRLATRADADGDGMPTSWELATGLDPAVDDSGADSDGDGTSNADEYAARSHPRGTSAAQLAEGATSDFFETGLTLVNADPIDDASITLRFLGGGGLVASEQLHVPAHSSRTLRLNDVPNLTRAEFSTIVESDRPVAAGRAMVWSAIPYGSHAQQGVSSSSIWYFAEGATTFGFQLFYLIQNTNETAADVSLLWLPADGRAAVERTYRVAALSRLTVWVNAIPELTNVEAGLVASTAAHTPIVVERAMYLDSATRTFEAGHVSAGATALSTDWYFAEGATGPYFDMFLLVANPTASDARLEVRYLLPDGASVVKTHDVGARRRATIWVDREDAVLASTAVGTTVRVLNGVPVVAERAMWWPGPTAATWQEAHVNLGLTNAGPRWVLADGETSGPGNADTYVLLANLSDVDVQARVTLLLESGATAESMITIPARSRRNVAVRREPWTVSAGSVLEQLAAGCRFGVGVEAVVPLDARLIVEGAVYHDARRGAVTVDAWAAGRVSSAVPLR